MSVLLDMDSIGGKAMDPGHRKKKKKGGMKRYDTPPPPPSEESTSGHDGGSESSLHDNMGGLDHSSQPGNGIDEKLTGELHHQRYSGID